MAAHTIKCSECKRCYQDLNAKSDVEWQHLLNNRSSTCTAHYLAEHDSGGSAPWRTAEDYAPAETAPEVQTEVCGVQYAYRVRNVRGDGYCFFEAVVRSMLETAPHDAPHIIATTLNVPIAVGSTLSAASSWWTGAIDSFVAILRGIATRLDDRELLAEIAGFAEPQADGRGGNLDVFFLIAHLFRVNIDVYSRSIVLRANDGPTVKHITHADALSGSSRFDPRTILLLDAHRLWTAGPTARSLDALVYTKNGQHYQQLLEPPSIGLELLT
jgi:hypothetical protein